MIVDQKKTNAIRQVRSSLAKDSSAENKCQAASTLKQNGVNLKQYNQVIKADLVREQAKKQQLNKSKTQQRDSGIGM